MPATSNRSEKKKNGRKRKVGDELQKRRNFFDKLPNKEGAPRFASRKPRRGARVVTKNASQGNRTREWKLKKLP